MKVVVTGAAGFIGSHLAERLCGRGDTVVGLDNFDPFYPRAVKERNLARLREVSSFRFIQGDLLNGIDLDHALAGGATDVVVHLAGLAGVRPSVEEPQRFYDVNVDGTLGLIEACRRHGCARMVFASSSSVYGDDAQAPFAESEPCNRPVSPYAATKKAGELLCYTAHHLHQMSFACLRFFTVYGPRQRPDLAIHKFTRLIAHGQPVELYGDGTTSRDYTWIDDIIDGVVATVDRQARDAAPAFRVYNLGGSQGTSLRELVDRIASALGKDPILSWKPFQPGDVVRTLADVTLARRELGYAPKVSVAEGIPRFVSWWRNDQAA
jgi:UDP-glucuronate 4-epimerase